MVEYKTVLNKETGELKKVAFGVQPPPQPPASSLGAEEIEALLSDDDKLRKLAKGALVEIVHSAPRNVSLVGACKELLDRIDGKAPQSVTMTVKRAGIADMTANEILQLRNDVAKVLGQEQLIIPPLPVIDN